ADPFARADRRGARVLPHVRAGDLPPLPTLISERRARALLGAVSTGEHCGRARRPCELSLRGRPQWSPATPRDLPTAVHRTPATPDGLSRAEACTAYRSAKS